MNNKEYYLKNKEKIKKRSNEYYANNKERVLKRETGRHFQKYFIGLSKEEAINKYKELRAIQNNVCAICNKPETSKKFKNLAVDHCRKTGKIRGLLCLTCNTTLGRFEKYLKEILLYLEKK